MAASEYGTPLLGDVVRARNPDKAVMDVGKIVKFPSYEGIRFERVEPRSISLGTLSTTVESPQRTLKQSVLDRYSGSKTSFIVPEGI